MTLLCARVHRSLCIVVCVWSLVATVAAQSGGGGLALDPVHGGDCAVVLHVRDATARGWLVLMSDGKVAVVRETIPGSADIALALEAPVARDGLVQAGFISDEGAETWLDPVRATGDAAVQDPTCRVSSDVREVLPFLDSTFVGFARARSVGAVSTSYETTFEADIVPNFVVYESLFKKLRQEFRRPQSAERPLRVSWSLTGVPMVRLRMFINEPSAPVKTPSYMPKGTAQLLLFRPGERRNTVDLFAAQATVGHHSNGQDGCLYRTEILQPNGDCSPPIGGVHPDTPVNKSNGSFSTNYLLFGFRYRWVHLKPATLADIRESDRDVSGGVDLELNPGDGNFLGGGGIDPDQKALYGPTRVTFVLGAAQRDVSACHRLEAKGSLKYINGQLATGVPSWVEAVDGTCLFTDGWGVSVRLYHGQDYYNLGYADNVLRFQIGLTYSQEGFLKFHLSEPTKTTSRRTQ